MVGRQPWEGVEAWEVLNGLERCLTVDALLMVPEDLRCGSPASKRIRALSWVSSDEAFKGDSEAWGSDMDPSRGGLGLLDGRGGGAVPGAPSLLGGFEDIFKFNCGMWSITDGRLVSLSCWPFKSMGVGDVWRLYELIARVVEKDGTPEDVFE